MPINYEKLYDVVIAEVSGSGSPHGRMQRVIDFCEEHEPSADWSRFRHLSYDEDVAQASKWVRRTLDGVAEDVDVEGMYFSISTYSNGPDLDLESSYADLDIRPTCDFDHEDEDFNWAFAYALKGKEGEPIGSDALAKIYRGAHGPDMHDAQQIAEYSLTLAFGAILATEAMRHSARHPRAQSLRGGCVGFSGGDGLFLGHVREGEFVSQPRAC